MKKEQEKKQNNITKNNNQKKKKQIESRNQNYSKIIIKQKIRKDTDKKNNLNEEIKNNNKNTVNEIQKRKNNKKLKWKKNMLLKVFFIIVFVVSTYKLMHFYIDLESNNHFNEKLIDDVLNTELSANEEDQELKEKLTVDFDKLLNMNSDTKGWIRFNDNKVNNPLVQTNNNNFYLDHSFQKNKNSLGTLFLDHRNKSLEDQNVVIFGHNAVDDSMFGSLVNIFEKDFFDKEEHKIIEIIDLKEESHKYEIFSYYVIEKEEYYITTSFVEDKEFQEFINTIKKRSIRNFNTTLSTKDKILTLSTCNGNGGTTKRTVIHAKKIN